jgi:5-methylthioadenosine/S-adenosylhomocysteine deaminase
MRVLRVALLVALVAGVAMMASLGRGGLSRGERVLLVTGGTVVTMDPQGTVIGDGAVAIQGSTIAAIGTSADLKARFAGARTINVAGQVIMPGLINTHTHAPMVLYRGLADDLALMDWLTKYIFPAEKATVSPEFVRIGTRLAALEMIESGTTTFADMYYFEDDIAEETKAAGLRGVLGQSVIQFPVADAATPDAALVRAEAFLEKWKGDPLITAAVAPHAPYTVPGPVLQAARALAKK